MSRRADIINAMTEGERRTLLAFIAVYRPQAFDEALGTYPDGFAAGVLARCAVDGEQGGGDADPFCATCANPAGIFYGYGDGWHHYRTAAGGTEIYDAGHAPVIGWRPPARCNLTAGDACDGAAPGGGDS